MLLCCASCGIAEVDEIKLKKCNDCDLIHYCSDTCQQEHRPEHEAKCKERAAELRDELLFRQPESTHLGDCPICCLPLVFTIQQNQITMFSCCSKVICNGCNFSNIVREAEGQLKAACPFCRHPPEPANGGEMKKIVMKRVEANDPVALRVMGTINQKEGMFYSAIEYWTKAAALGDADAHCKLAGYLNMEEDDVEKDEGKELYHWEEAAIAGHPIARCSLASYELKKGRVDRAAKHVIISANLGWDKSIVLLKNFYKLEYVSKEDFASALRAHQVAVDATKSPQREAAAKFRAGMEKIRESMRVNGYTMPGDV